MPNYKTKPGWPRPVLILSLFFETCDIVLKSVYFRGSERPEHLAYKSMHASAFHVARSTQSNILSAAV